MVVEVKRPKAAPVCRNTWKTHNEGKQGSRCSTRTCEGGHMRSTAAPRRWTHRCCESRHSFIIDRRLRTCRWGKKRCRRLGWGRQRNEEGRFHQGGKISSRSKTAERRNVSSEEGENKQIPYRVKGIHQWGGTGARRSPGRKQTSSA